MCSYLSRGLGEIVIWRRGDAETSGVYTVSFTDLGRNMCESIFRQTSSIVIAYK